jgi:hypothetical protein
VSQLDYLVLEDLLVERLKDKLPELKEVLTAMDLSGVQKQRLSNPAAHVIYLGDDVGQGAGSQSGSGSAQAVTQQWMVVLVVKFAGTVSSGKGNRETAGPLIAKLLQALSGWQPAAPLTALKRINAPKVGYENGFAYYPFAFKTTHVTIGKT